MGQQRFSGKAVKRIRAAVKKIESAGGSTGGNRRATPAPPGRPIGIGVMVGDIGVNTWGEFKKARGEKGSEEGFGETYPCYYRGIDGSASILDEALVYWVWIGEGYEVSPAECPE